MGSTGVPGGLNNIDSSSIVIAPMILNMPPMAS